MPSKRTHGDEMTKLLVFKVERPKKQSYHNWLADSNMAKKLCLNAFSINSIMNNYFLVFAKKIRSLPYLNYGRYICMCL